MWTDTRRIRIACVIAVSVSLLLVTCTGSAGAYGSSRATSNILKQCRGSWATNVEQIDSVMRALADIKEPVSDYMIIKQGVANGGGTYRLRTLIITKRDGIALAHDLRRSEASVGQVEREAAYQVLRAQADTWTNVERTIVGDIASEHIYCSFVQMRLNGSVTNVEIVGGIEKEAEVRQAIREFYQYVVEITGPGEQAGFSVSPLQEDRIDGLIDSIERNPFFEIEALDTQR